MNANNDTTYNIGAIAGKATTSVIKSSIVQSQASNVVSFKFASSAHANSAYIGGVVGELINSQINATTVQNLTINNELNVQKVANAKGAIGGLAGIISAKNANTDIANSIVLNTKLTSTEFAPASDASVFGYYTGGIVGEIPVDVYRANTSNIYGCQATTTLNGNIVGGIVGSTYGNIEKVYVNTDATGWKVGGVAGYQLNYSTLKNCLIEGTLHSSTIENNTTYSISIANVKDRKEVAGISAVASMLVTANEDSSSPIMDTCLVRCAFDSENAYKDSASVKCANNNTFYFLSRYAKGIPVLQEAKFDDDTYKMFPFTARTINIVYQNVDNSNAKDRPDISNTEGTFSEFSYDYQVTTLGDDYAVFDNFDTSVWNIDKTNKTVSLKF